MYLVNTKHVKVNGHLKCFERTTLCFTTEAQAIVYSESTETEQRAMNLILRKQVFKRNNQVLYGT